MGGSANSSLHIGLISLHTSPLATVGSGDGGGMNVYINQVSKTLAKLGHTVSVFTRQTRENEQVVTVTPGYRVYPLKAGPLDTPKEGLEDYVGLFSDELQRLELIDEIDIFHGHYWLSALAGLPVAKANSIKFVQTFHTIARMKNLGSKGQSRCYSEVRSKAEGDIAKSVDAIASPSPLVAKWIEENFETDAELRVIEPGYDSNIFYPPERVSQRSGKILFAGRLQPLKAPDVAIKAVAKLAHRAELIIAGESSSQQGFSIDDLKALARDEGIENRVTFLGALSQEELADYMREADIVIMPSMSETFGLVALEAQACGTVVVGSDVFGLRHILGERDGVTGGGFLVEAGSVAGFATIMDELLGDQNLLDEMRYKAIERSRFFSWDRCAYDTIKLYHSLM